MTEQRPFPFGGIPVYNPQSLSKTKRLRSSMRDKRPTGA